jgi:ABC-2 type transport system ATP-binding protein
VIDNLRALGKTILLTTHYMDEAQNLADRVAVISGGVIVAEGTPDTLGGRADAASIIRFRLDGAVAASLPVQQDKVHVEPGGTIEIKADDPTRLLHTLTGWALDTGTDLLGLTVQRPSLEDVYLELAGEESGDG